LKKAIGKFSVDGGRERRWNVVSWGSWGGKEALKKSTRKGRSGRWKERYAKETEARKT